MAIYLPEYKKGIFEVKKGRKLIFRADEFTEALQYAMPLVLLGGSKIKIYKNGKLFERL